MNFVSMAGGARGAALGRERVETHRALGEARDAASHSALYFDPSGRTRLINANARSNAFGSSLLVDMSPLWENVSW